MKKDLSAALPLLFAGLLLAAGTAGLLLPFFPCPPCRASGVIVEGSSQEASFYVCNLCRQRGRLPAITRFLADPSPDSHRGDLFLITTGVHLVSP